MSDEQTKRNRTKRLATLQLGQPYRFAGYVSGGCSGCGGCLCDILELDAKNREDKTDPAGAIAAVQARMNDFTAEELASMFEGRDCCCSIVKSISEAFSDPHFIARGLFAHQLVKGDGQAMSAIPVSIVPEFRSNPSVPRSAPGIGEHNDEILKSDA